MIEGVKYINDFIEVPNTLMNFLKNKVEWDERILARKTASFGKAYNYSQIEYPYKELVFPLTKVISKLTDFLGFETNNCLINYYLDGKSKLGFHSDIIDILKDDTGIAIISLGETRILRFKNILDETIVIDFILENGSLIYMTQEVQKLWKHAVPKSDTSKERMSLTFRKIK